MSKVQKLGITGVVTGKKYTTVRTIYSYELQNSHFTFLDSIMILCESFIITTPVSFHLNTYLL